MNGSDWRWQSAAIINRSRVLFLMEVAAGGMPERNKDEREKEETKNEKKNPLIAFASSPHNHLDRSHHQSLPPDSFFWKRQTKKERKWMNERGVINRAAPKRGHLHFSDECTKVPSSSPFQHLLMASSRDGIWWLRKWNTNNCSFCNKIAVVPFELSSFCT